jgi:hypothetical protein
VSNSRMSAAIMAAVLAMRDFPEIAAPAPSLAKRPAMPAEPNPFIRLPLARRRTKMGLSQDPFGPNPKRSRQKAQKRARKAQRKAAK